MEYAHVINGDVTTCCLDEQLVNKIGNIRQNHWQNCGGKTRSMAIGTWKAEWRVGHCVTGNWRSVATPKKIERLVGGLSTIE